jgi:glycosyltransferase involved in cell wall biosynthesis
MKPNKKVLFISHDGSVSGAPISLSILIKYFKKNTDWDVKLLIIRPGPLEEKLSEVIEVDIYYKYFDYTSAGSSNIFTKATEKTQQVIHQKKLKNKLQKWVPDLIYSNTAINGEEILKLDLQSDTLVHVRELNMALDTMNKRSEREFQIKPLLYFAVSKAVKFNLIKRYKIPEHKIKIVPVALECSLVKQEAAKFSPSEIRKKLNIPSNSKVIGAVGHVSERKGPNIFLEVAKKFFKQSPNSKSVFVWAGEGWDLERYRKEVKIHNLEANVKFIGLISDIYPLIKSFDVLLMTSIDDPFPRVNLEAGILGVPVIAFKESGGSCEYIEKDCGVSVDKISSELMLESLNYLLNNEQKCREIRSIAPKKVETLYDINAVGPLALSLINETFGSSNSHI